MFSNEETDGRFGEIWAILNGEYPTESDLEKAQALLDEIKEKDAERCYVQAAIDYYKRFYYDCKKQLKKAIKLEPENGKYKAALEELEEMARNAKAAGNPLPDRNREDVLSDCCTGCCGGLCDGFCAGF